jgi:hypothetical protein
VTPEQARDFRIDGVKDLEREKKDLEKFFQ